MVSTLVDTHAHIYLDTFQPELAEMVARATAAGVEAIYMPGIESADIPALMAVEAAFPGICHAMMGVHPCYVKDGYQAELDIVSDWLQKRPFAAVGEVGLDFYWDMTYAAAQRDAFEVQVDWAAQHRLPVVIHARKSTEACIDIIRKKQDGRLTGIFHCFSGTVDEAREIIGLGFHLGIGGVLTYKNGGLAPVLEAVGLEYVVLETDAPYLAPVPFRGKRNEPMHLRLVAEKMAAVMGISVEQVADQTTRNARTVFG